MFFCWQRSTKRLGAQLPVEHVALAEALADQLQLVVSGELEGVFSFILPPNATAARDAILARQAVYREARDRLYVKIFCVCSFLVFAAKCSILG